VTAGALFFPQSLLGALDSNARFVDNSSTLNGATIRRRSVACELTKSRIAGRASFGFVILLAFLLLGLLNLAGCMAFTASLNTSQSLSTSSSSPPAPSAAVPVPPQATPSSVAFGTVSAGVNYNETVLLSNVGSVDVTVTQVIASGSGFAVSPFSLPLTLTAGQSASLAVAFDSTTPGGASGALAVTSNATGSPTSIGLSATVAATAVQLSANSSSVSFGNSTVGVSTVQDITLTNTGNSTVSISSISAGNPEFTVSGTPNVTLAPNQSVSVALNFDPTAAGPATGTLLVTSNAPQVQIPLSGTGVPAPQFAVTLNWSPSTSTVVGYYVYRATGVGAQLSKFSGIVTSTSYQDTSVAAGHTYIYAVTSVDSNNVESDLSTPVSVTIPSQ
jgi:hypothetical protein